MNSCGMYNYAGQWSYEVGMPAKSGVSGCIMAVIPGQVGVGVYSPPLDAQGNSVRGIKVCQDISNEFELHPHQCAERNPPRLSRRPGAIEPLTHRAGTQHARRRGIKIAVIEVQGALFFGSTEQLLRRVAELSETARYVIVDFKRVHLADSAARKLILRLAHAMRDGETELLFAEIANDGPLATVSQELAAHEMDRLVRVFRDVDAALEWCEDQLLVEMLRIAPGTKFALAQLDVFKGMSLEEYRLLETIVSPLVFDKGEIIIREGDQAKLFFVLARGSVSVQIKVPTQTGEKRRRVASLGPGLTFGEMALFDGGARSADVVAGEKVICYGLAVEQLKELAVAHPNIMVTILSNLTRDFSERLRHANEAIRSLE
jgi:glutaminase